MNLKKSLSAKVCSISYTTLFTVLFKLFNHLGSQVFLFFKAQVLPKMADFCFDLKIFVFINILIDFLS